MLTVYLDTARNPNTWDIASTSIHLEQHYPQDASDWPWAMSITRSSATTLQSSRGLDGDVVL